MTEYGRYCESCGRDHGPLYICDSYSPELKAEIQKESDQFVKNHCDPEWCRKQIESGVDPLAIAFGRFFAGLDG